MDRIDSLSSVEFSFYTREEAEQMACVDIKSQLAFKKDKTPSTDGLYDPRLGVDPADDRGVCQTCSQSADDCVGHQGIINLCLPFINPLYFTMVYKFMKGKCSQCHRLRIPFERLSTLIRQHKLLTEGKLMEAQSLEEQLSSKLGYGWLKEPLGDLIKSEHMQTYDMDQDLPSEHSPPTHTRNWESSLVGARNKLIKDFWKSFQPKCPYCSTRQPRITKEGYLKINRLPIGENPKKRKKDTDHAKDNEPVQMLPSEIKAELDLLFDVESETLGELFSPSLLAGLMQDYLIVPPTRFRPLSKLHGAEAYMHPQTISLSRIFQVNKKLEKLLEKGEGPIMETYNELQAAVNLYMDASTSSRLADKDATGLRQLLEKKAGLFRLKMMGKRVNYAARSVISPDPYIETGEIGIPVVFARTLTFPEPVTRHNVAELRRMVENGANVHPGANAIQELNGRKVLLSNLSTTQRRGMAAKLLVGGRKVVFRHLLSGDWLLVNRQPTLHKPGMMAHRARVLPEQNTIRMHYVNCNAYNADFDGDEINLHFAQSQQCRAEALCISSTDFQYTSCTSGKPLRGLIHDYVISGVLLAAKDSFFTWEEFCQLVFCATGGSAQLLPPCILRPRALWSGKQIISCVLQSLARGSQLTMEQACKVPGHMWAPEEGKLCVRNGYVCTGVLDKNHIGASEFGLVHAYDELYGASSTLLTALSRLLTQFFQIRGFTCSISDLLLSPAAENLRDQWIQEFPIKLSAQISVMLNSQDDLPTAIREQVRQSEMAAKEFDIKVMSLLNVSSSRLQEHCLPKGLLTAFPQNSFSAMVTSGSKGTMVNHKQCSLMLGQQELEGRRVPLTMFGKSLPSFEAYDPSPEAGGFISGRFVSGLNPAQYYFHCMAGREGLVDTAVKTSRSGYLQRCLIKGLEGLVVHYDLSVRDCDGSLVQFLYGEDGIDPSKSKYVQAFKFLSENKEAIKEKYKYDEALQAFDLCFREAHRVNKQEDRTYQSENSIASELGALPPLLDNLITDYIKDQNLQWKMGTRKNKLPRREFKQYVSLKYLRSLVEPGETVGIIAGQSIGEPSTQLTLNTFHLAGHGGVNVTLGIPRLREILMTGASNIQTPTMTASMIGDRQAACKFRNSLQKVVFRDLVRYIKIRAGKEIKIFLYLEDRESIKDKMDIDWELISEQFLKKLVPAIDNFIDKAIRLGKAKGDLQVTKPTEAPETTEGAPEKEKQKQKKKREIKTYESDEEEHKEEKEEKMEEDIPKSDLKYCIDCTKSSKNSLFKITVDIPKNSTILLLTEVEKSLDTSVREVSGIGKCHITGQAAYTLQTEGVNFSVLWENPDIVDVNSVKSNDIIAVLKTYGVEAAYFTIIAEINSIFSHYGISVDRRHLSLIADYMTFNGEYRAFNRQGMADHASPFLRMTYETTMNFLTQSAASQEVDDGMSPASALVMGKVPKIGSNFMEIYHKLPKND